MRCLKLLKADQQGIETLIDDRLKIIDSPLGEEGADSSTALSMNLVVKGAKHGFGNSKLSCDPVPSIAALSRTGEDLFVERRGCHMQLIWIDADDRAILIVQVLDLEGVLSAFDYVVVEFIPPRWSARLEIGGVHLPTKNSLLPIEGQGISQPDSGRDGAPLEQRGR